MRAARPTISSALVMRSSRSGGLHAAVAQRHVDVVVDIEIRASG